MNPKPTKSILFLIIASLCYFSAQSQTPVIIPGSAWGGVQSNPPFAFQVGNIWYILNEESWWTLNIESNSPKPLNNEELNTDCVNPQLVMYNSEGYLLCFLPQTSLIMSFQSNTGLNQSTQLEAPILLSNMNIETFKNDLAVFYSTSATNSTCYVYNSVFNSIIYSVNINEEVNSMVPGPTSFIYETINAEKSGNNDYSIFLYQVSTKQTLLLTQFQSTSDSNIIGSFKNNEVFVVYKGYYEAISWTNSIQLNNINQFIKYNNTHFLAVQGNNLIFAYWSNGLNFNTVSSLNLYPYMQGKLQVDVATYQGFSSILVEFYTNTEPYVGQSLIVLELNPVNMEINKASVPQTINGRQEVYLANGTIALVSPVGYFLIKPGVVFVPMEFSAFYYQASNPGFLYGYYSDAQNCYITQFEASNSEITVFPMKNCPCQTYFPLNPLVSFLAVNPYNGFPVSAVSCNRTYFVLTGSVYGPFSNPALMVRPSTFINPATSMLHLLNTFDSSGVQLISFNYTQGNTPYYDTLSSPSFYILPYSVKISEDMFMFGIVSPLNQWTNLFVYSLQSPNFVQNFTIPTILPQAIAPFVWNESDPQPVSLIAVQIGVTNVFVAYTANGEQITFGSGTNIYAICNGEVGSTGNNENLNWNIWFNVEEEAEKGISA